MAVNFADRVRQLSISTGTGAITFSAGETGYRTFAAVYAQDESLSYCIEGLTSGGALSGQWETGRGHLNISGQLVRDEVYASSTGGLVNFSSASLRVFVTASTLGLDSWVDAAIAAASPPLTRSITAGAGLTGGGDLSANRTLNVVANADGSIVVNADDVQVGVLATNAQHGNRGGGALHAAFTDVAAGFVPASGGGTTNFLRADGTFAAPPGGGGGSPGGSTTELQYNNAGAFGGVTGLTYNSTSKALTFAPTSPSGSALIVTTTLPSGGQKGIFLNVTAAGADASHQAGLHVALNAGYTGSSLTAAIAGYNANVGVGSNPVGAEDANIGGTLAATGTTTGWNIGARGRAGLGDKNAGLLGVSLNAKDNAANVGVMGLGGNSGATPIQVGGFFHVNTSFALPTLNVSAALIADNTDTLSPIFLARDNGTTVFTIANGGNAIFGGQLTNTSGNLIASPTANYFQVNAAAQGGFYGHGLSSDSAEVYLDNTAVGFTQLSHVGVDNQVYAGTVAGDTILRAGGATGRILLATNAATAITVFQGGNVSIASLATTGVTISTSGLLSTVAPGASGNVLTSNGTTWTSAAPSGGGGGWTDDGSVVRLTTAADQVAIGTAAPTAGDTFTVAPPGSPSGHTAVITAGALASTKQAFKVTGTLSTTDVSQIGADINITSAGTSTNGNQTALRTILGAGYTGTNDSRAAFYLNQAAGTGTLEPVTGSDALSANYGVQGRASPTGGTSGAAIGARGMGYGGAIAAGALNVAGSSFEANNGFRQDSTNYGSVNAVTLAKHTSSTIEKHIGSVSVALNGDTSIAAFAGLVNAAPSWGSGAFTSAGLVASNGTTAFNIFRAVDDTVAVFTIADGGIVTAGPTSTIVNNTGYPVNSVRDNGTEQGATGAWTFSSTATHAAVMGFERARGTSASPTALSAGDVIGSLNFNGYTNDRQTAAQIRVIAGTGWGASGADAPGDISFLTSPDGSATPAERLRIASTGNIQHKAHAAFTGSENVESTGAVQTTNATQTSVWSMTLADNTVYFIQAQTVGRGTDGADRMTAIDFALVYRQGGGGATLQGSPVDIVTPIKSTGATTWDVSITVSGNDVRVSVTGAAATTINWATSIDIQGVSGNS